MAGKTKSEYVTTNPNAEQRAALRRARALLARKRKIDAELKGIKDAIFAELVSLGIDGLSVDGRNVALIVPTEKQEVDESAAASANPEIFRAWAVLAAAHTKVVPGTRRDFNP